MFNRFYLNGYQFKQPWDALVYHFTSRGSRFNKHSGGAAGKNSNEWIETTTRNGRNFIRKWGHFIKHDSLMKPIVPPKYNIGFVVKNCNLEILELLEPWCDTIYIEDDMQVMTIAYFEKEKNNTIYDLSERIKPYNNEKNSQQLPEIIKDSGDIGTFQIGNIFIDIIQMNEYQNTLIKL